MKKGFNLHIKIIKIQDVPQCNEKFIDFFLMIKGSTYLTKTKNDKTVMCNNNFFLMCSIICFQKLHPYTRTLNFKCL